MSYFSWQPHTCSAVMAVVAGYHYLRMTAKEAKSRHMYPMKIQQMQNQ
jgi:hypothetical protein